MIPVLAQDALPTPPETTDPVTWIAMAGFLVIALLLGWQLRNGATERKEGAAEREATAKRQDAAQAAFLAALESQRAHDDTRTEKTHGRISELATEVRRLAERAA